MKRWRRFTSTRRCRLRWTHGFPTRVPIPPRSDLLPLPLAPVHATKRPEELLSLSPSPPACPLSCAISSHPIPKPSIISSNSSILSVLRPRPCLPCRVRSFARRSPDPYPSSCSWLVIIIIIISGLTASPGPCCAWSATLRVLVHARVHVLVHETLSPPATTASTQDLGFAADCRK